MGVQHGRRLWGQFWTLDVVGSVDSAVSHWVVYGHLGAGDPALGAGAGHRGWTLVSGDSGNNPDAIEIGSEAARCP